MMKSMLFKPEILKAKLEVLNRLGEAQTRRVESSLREINENADYWEYKGVIINKFYKETYAFEVPQTTTGRLFIKPRYQVGDICYLKDKLFLAEKDATDFVKITNVRCERLHNLTHDGAIKEGVEYHAFANMWDSAHGKQKRSKDYTQTYDWESSDGISHKHYKKVVNPNSWAANPWVIVYKMVKWEGTS